MLHRRLLEHVRGQLVREMEELQGTLSRTVVRLKEGSDRMADVVDQAAAEHDRTMEMMIRGRESRLVREIRETILRIDQGRFGVCCRCGTAITPKRLLLMPMSRLCASCKGKLEPVCRVQSRSIPVEADHHAC